ncbi:MAG: hypothetical protein SFV15_18230 [Polyangiaceae bacterium]|nr:hypothetical protein [Polyangiaceae bacterium]
MKIRLTFGTLGLLAGVLVAPAGAQAASPRREAEALLAKLAKSERAALIATYTRRAESALTRALAATSKKQLKVAEQLESVALRLALTAQDLLRATDLERQASSLELQLNLAQEKTVRARALIEEALARKNRALAQLKESETQSKALPAQVKKP